nr:Ig-like domain-containing protein [Rosenbergiella epipactidis]
MGTTTADQDGNWTFTPSVALADGEHNVTATATTAAGSSSPSAGFDFTVDTQAPGKPSIDGVTETGHPDKAIADHATATTSEVTFNGHAEANSTVVLKDSNGKEVGRGQADSKGEWNIGVTLENGTHDITAQAIDKAENISPASSPYDLTVDTSASMDPDSGKPTAPVITDVVDKAHTDVTIKAHDTTKVNELTFKGTSAAGAQITLKDGDKEIGTTTANAQGNWSFTPNVAFSDGPHDVTATASNLAGSSLPSAGYDFTVDTLAPEKPVIDVVLDGSNVAIADHSTTNVDQLTFKGTAEQNSTVTLKDSDGHVLGSDVADDQGNWSITTSGTISEGTHDVTATATDAAHNESEKSDAFDFTKTSAVVPPTPTVPDVTQPGETYTYDGKSTSIGADLSNAGDVNGDGFDDFLLTAPGAEEAFLLYGSANGLPKVPDLSKGLTADQGIEISGGMDGNHNKQGWHVENIGDFDGDGYDDFVVADHYPDKVFVVYGGPNSNNKLDLNAIEKGDNSKGFMITHSDGDSWLGISVAGGDIDGDGYSDLFFGNSEAHNGQGNIYSLYGHEGKTQTNIYIDRSKDSWFEASGQNQWRGSVFNPQSDKDLTTQNGVFGHNLGETMANIGDVNGDGIDDFLFADTLASNHLSPNGYGGTAYVVYGKKGGFGDKFNLDDLTINDGIRINAPFDTWLGGDNGSHSMHNIANIGDINGDGIDDFAIGSPVANHANDAGYTVVIYGKKGGFDRDIDLDFTMKGNNPKGGYNRSSHSLTAKDGFVLFPENYGGENANKATWSGESIVGIGDINGDGIDDFIVTANGQDNNAGAAYVIYGKEGGLVSGNGVDPIINLKDIATDPTLGYKLQGAADSQFGTNATAGDWNGDGFTDFAIGAQNANGGNGETYIYYAQPKYTQFYTEGNDHIQARTGEHNLLLGGKGDDVITNIGAGINDYANGGEGNDEVHIVSLDFKAVAGGQGIDTLVLDGNNMMLDLMSAKNKVTGFEKFDLGDHTNTLNVGFDDVLRLGEENLFKHDGSDGKKQLIIDGGDSDTLNLINKGQKWAEQDDQSIDGHTYHTYTAGSNVEILVDSHIQTSIL